MKTDWSFLDVQMRTYAPFFRDEFDIDGSKSNNIATVMAQEICSLDSDVLHELRTVDPVEPKNRLDELVAFQYWMDVVHSSQQHPAIVRAQVITQNYVCFVYLGESVFRILRAKTPNGTVTKKCCKFLTDNPVRAFRNALAHANWKYKTDFSGITYWAKKGDQKDEPLTKWEVSQHQLGFWQALARCVGYVVFTELQEMKVDE